MRKHRSGYFFVLLILVGCVNLTAPRDLRDRIVYAYGGIQLASASINNLLDTGAMTTAEAQPYAVKLRTVKDALDIALALHSTNPADAQAKYTAANKLLLTVQTELDKRLEATK